MRNDTPNMPLRLTWYDYTVILLALENHQRILSEDWRNAVGVDVEKAGTLAHSLNELNPIRKKINKLRKIVA